MTLKTKRKFTIEEYHRLTEIGFFHEDDRIELIDGEIIEMVSKGVAHVFCCQKLIKNLVQLIGDEAILRCQDPIILLNNSEPEPDFTIARNCDDSYLSHHPYPEDIILVIEIADSSLDYDRQVKLPLYAEAGIAEYWIVNLFDRQLEVYRQPYQKTNGGFNYSQQQIFLPEATVPLHFFKDRTLNLSTIFPAQ
ncbi:Uma2 family endonuclease [Oscillatoriales cyanobacterium LEGE 11467]|uniref:Uma2 family endonuclease n=1 Tax=Zarconia navalis LEGE 11467 TaxID=1828826 RepID=A0A928VWS4_9CYAN|nr:Uma2 family endonuclease [Zarconia navalis]MBE9039230.1 Uma2 family endonuclease [Zarconia navalis LEGE 11467]